MDSASGGGPSDPNSVGGEAPLTTTTASGSTSSPAPSSQPPSRYESQKRRDWNTFLQYLKNHKPPLTLARCSGAHVIEFLKYLDQFGKTKVHNTGCPYFGQPIPPAPCACPLKQAWGSLDALIGRLRAAYDESGGRPESNPFGARAVRIYLREVREGQAKARGIPYEKKKRKRPTTVTVAENVMVGPSNISAQAQHQQQQAGTAAAAADDGGQSGQTTSAAGAVTTTTTTSTSTAV